MKEREYTKMISGVAVRFKIEVISGQYCDTIVSINGFVWGTIAGSDIPAFEDYLQKLADFKI